MNISYHSWKDYQECPKKYYLKNVRRKPPDVPRNDYFAMYGKLVEKFFQVFCNTWRYKSPHMFPDDIKAKLTILYEDVLRASTVDWTAQFVKATKDDIFNQALADVCTVMDSDTQNYFLNTRSEVTVKLALKNNVNINGRLDFIHQDPLNTQVVTIFDGKGASDIGKNVNDDQILFYALLHLLHFKVMPEHLGFFYYRFNLFKPVDINFDILNEFRARLSLDLKQIQADTAFTATPCPKACKYCDYRTNCPECQDDQAKRKRGPKLDIPYQDGLFNLEL